MKEIKGLVSAVQFNGISAYFNLYNKISKKVEGNFIKKEKTIKLCYALNKGIEIGLTLRVLQIVGQVTVK
jgi:hypothetical protein|tara:strand:- start:581 stop:790 length:210 start_codon:yes stop_codon:yes gene_type:complete